MTSITAAHISKLLKSSKGFDKIIEKIIITNFKDGNCTAEMTVCEEHTNPMGGLHGGMSATLVDNISTYALVSHPAGGAISVSVDLHLTYMKGAQIGDTIEIDAKTVKVGKSLAFLDVIISNKSTGHVLVKGTHTKYLLDGSK